MSTPDVRLAVEDAVELAELLDFVDRFLVRPDVIAAWRSFVGIDFDVEIMRVDLARFVFLLGGTGDGLSLGIDVS